MGEDTRRGFVSYSTLKKIRLLELFSIILIHVFIAAGTVCFVLYHHVHFRHITTTRLENCGPNFMDYSQNLSGADKTVDGSYRMDDMIFTVGTFWKANGSVFGCPCSLKPCIRKCCKENEKYQVVSDEEGNVELHCKKSNTTSFSPFLRKVYSPLSVNDSIDTIVESKIEPNHFFILQGNVCGKNNMYQKTPEEEPDDEHYIMDDGRILNYHKTSMKMLYMNQSQYCLDSYVGSDTIHTFECFGDNAEELTEKEHNWVFIVLASGMLISVIFLLITFVVYALVPQLQNIHGKSLMCHVACLMVAFLTLAAVQLEKLGPLTLVEVETPRCEFFAFVMQFTFMSSFFWLNTMCIDIWWTFSGLNPPVRGSEHWKFLIYSLYAWGAPLMISLCSAVLEFVPGIPGSFIKPRFNVNSCWFEDDDALVLYFYLPIGTVICFNAMLFLATSFRLRASSRDVTTKQLASADSRRHNGADTLRFQLYLKLFMVMGLTWVMELVSFMVGGSKVSFLAFDLGNSLQGLAIFLMFVCQRRTLGLLKKRLFPPPLTFASSTAQGSRSTDINSTSVRRANDDGIRMANLEISTKE